MSLTRVFDITFFRETLVCGVKTRLYAERDDFISSITADFELKRELIATFNELVDDFCERLDCRIFTCVDPITQRHNIQLEVFLRDEPEKEVDESPSV